MHSWFYYRNGKQLVNASINTIILLLILECEQSRAVGRIKRLGGGHRLACGILGKWARHLKINVGIVWLPKNIGICLHKCHVFISWIISIFILFVRKSLSVRKKYIQLLFKYLSTLSYFTQMPYHPSLSVLMKILRSHMLSMHIVSFQNNTRQVLPHH